jgi:RND family efflux transporter MFP subunit
MLLLASVILLSSCEKPQSEDVEDIRPIRTMKVDDISQIERRSFPGRAKATQEVELSFRVTGPLITLPVKVGDKIDKDDTVARIDPRDFEVTVRNMKGQLQRVKATRSRAKSEYERLLKVQKKDKNLVSETRVDRAKEDYETAKADISALQASVDAANDALKYTYLKAPYAGTVVATYVENFEYVNAKQPVLRLLDNTQIEFTFNLPETMISLIGYVQNLRVHFDAFPEKIIPALVKEVGTEASETTRTYPITLILDQPADVVILPGMAGAVTGEARLPGKGEQRDIVVPVTAVFSSDKENKSFVWIIDEATNTTHRREVKLGSLISTGIVVESGLEPGEQIATAGVNYLTEGQHVRPTLE